jgi:hypothetical protein
MTVLDFGTISFGGEVLDYVTKPVEAAEKVVGEC